MDMTSYPDLKGRVVLITGGANGIGAAAVRAFHQQGARVFFCDLDARSGRALAKDLSSNITFTKLADDRATAPGVRHSPHQTAHQKVPMRPGSD